MKMIDLRSKSNDDLAATLKELKETMFNLKFQAATGQLENVKHMSLLKRDVARVKTVLNERQNEQKEGGLS